MEKIRSATVDRKISEVPEVLLDPLYEAATRPELWKTFLQRASEILRADTAAIIFHDPSSARTGIKADLGFTQELRSDITRLIKFSPWMREILKYQKVGWYSGSPEDVLSMEAFRKTEFYNDLFRKHNLESMCVSLVFSPKGSFKSFAVSRQDRRASFNEADKQLMKLLVPHLARVFRVHRTVASLRQRNAAGQHALDLIGAACITLGGNTRVMSMNRRAEALISKGEVLRLKDGRLKAALTADQHVLDACILQVCRDGSSPGASPCAVSLHSRQGSLLYISILPYHANEPYLEELEDTPAALVFITTPEEQGEGEHRLWLAMFGLTPAECRVAEMMKQGSEVSEISEALKIRINTVRYYQKSIYRKTGVPGQGSLMRLLTRLPSSDT